MVFPATWFCIPIHVVLCNNSLLWELLPERSKGADRASCQCNSCSDIYCSSSSCCCTGSFVVIFCYALILLADIHNPRELRDDSPKEKVASPEHAYRKVTPTGTMLQAIWGI